MSTWLVLALAMLASCAVVLTVAVLRERRTGGDEDTSQTPDVIEYIIMMIGVVYAIVLGLAIAGVWEQRNAATDWVNQEAQALHEVHTRVSVYPDETRERIRSDIEAYAAHAVDDEWAEADSAGELTPRGDALLARLRKDVARFEPGTTLESHAYQGVVDQAMAADRARAERGDSAGTTMPAVVWFGLIIGALVVVGMIFVLQIRRSARELLLAGLFSALIAFLLFLIWHFDAPYARGLSDAAAAYEALLPKAAGD